MDTPAFNFSEQPEISELLNRVQEMAHDQPLYLVGGAVRDLLTGRPLHDLDFAMPSDPRPLAHRLADALQGDIFMLDDARHTARVIHHTPSGSAIFLDFAIFRGSSLEEDLRGRDFTLNALALELSTNRPVDPLGGINDLRQKILRACSPTAFTDDPLRVLRGVRFALSLGCRMDAATWTAMKQAAPLLGRVSPERCRDELFYMLEAPHAASAIRLLDQAGALPELLPEVAALRDEAQGPPHVYDVFEHTLAALKELEQIYSVLVEPYSEEKANRSLISGLAVLKLGQYRKNLAEHFSVALNPHRSRRGLLFLAALLHDCAKPESRTVEPSGRVRFLGHDSTGAPVTVARAQAMMLSQAEVQHLEKLVAGHMRIHHLANIVSAPSRRAIYRYFQATGSAGIDLCLLSLADTLATYGAEIPPARWQAELDVCRMLLQAWWEKGEEIVNPPRLISGDDLMAQLGLPSGPQIGILLEAIREAQATGEITTRQQALDFARSKVNSLS